MIVKGWYRYKFGMPVIKSFRPWVNGGRFVFEAVPSITFIEDNDDYQGQTVS